MLAQNFKSASDLGLTEEAFSAFVKVLGLMEREEIPERLFTMAHVGEPYMEGDCQTAGCILGWARAVSLPLQNSHWGPAEGQPAYKLCFPEDCVHYPKFASAYDATREQAARALRNFLTHGEPRWAEVLS